MAGAVVTEGLGKRYPLGSGGSGYSRLTETLQGALARWTTFQSRPRQQTFWALRDVSLEIQPGESVAIIGPNGAGKTTLLKILSRITEPTEGTARLRGRVGSLLEVGTGFHPELSGAENIYLNGAILGMNRAEINAKFDAIVAFAEVEGFLETPVKRYSSGMYVRLAFSVAAHLEPDVLIVDEVLAVGDASFQKKCLGRMGDVANEGRTVLFVSHNMPAVLGLCDRAYWLDGGYLLADGPTAEIVGSYLESAATDQQGSIANRSDRSGDGSVRITAIEASGIDEKVIRSTAPLRLRMSYVADAPVKHMSVLIGIYDLGGTGIYLLDSNAFGGLVDEAPKEGIVEVTTGPLNLVPGRCLLNVALSRSGVMADYVQRATAIDVEPDDAFGAIHVPGRDWVLGLIDQRWKVG